MSDLLPEQHPTRQYHPKRKNISLSNKDIKNNFAILFTVISELSKVILKFGINENTTIPKTTSIKTHKKKNLTDSIFIPTLYISKKRPKYATKWQSSKNKKRYYRHHDSSIRVALGSQIPKHARSRSSLRRAWLRQPQISLGIPAHICAVGLYLTPLGNP